MFSWNFNKRSIQTLKVCSPHPTRGKHVFLCFFLYLEDQIYDCLLLKVPFCVMVVFPSSLLLIDIIPLLKDIARGIKIL